MSVWFLLPLLRASVTYAELKVKSVHQLNRRLYSTSILFQRSTLGVICGLTFVSEVEVLRSLPLLLFHLHFFTFNDF